MYYTIHIRVIIVNKTEQENLTKTSTGVFQNSTDEFLTLKPNKATFDLLINLETTKMKALQHISPFIFARRFLIERKLRKNSTSREPQASMERRRRRDARKTVAGKENKYRALLVNIVYY